MTPRHHPSDELLLDYAAGAAPEPVALLVATHLSFCPHCRAASRRLEAVGGRLLDELEPAPLAADALDRCLARAAAPERERAAAPAVPDGVPAPLAGYLGGRLADLPWRDVVRGVGEIALPCATHRGYKASLLRIAAGRAIPRHGHRGDEFLLVIEGSFTDERGHYGAGDVAEADGAVVHRPVAGTERDCYCLVVSSGPIRLKGWLGWAVNPFLPA